MKDKNGYCPICGKRIYALWNGRRWIHGCLKCKRKFKMSEILWGTQKPRITKKMLQYQTMLRQAND